MNRHSLKGMHEVVTAGNPNFVTPECVFFFLSKSEAQTDRQVNGHRAPPSRAPRQKRGFPLVLLHFYFYSASGKRTRVWRQNSCCRMRDPTPNEMKARMETRFLSQSLLSPTPCRQGFLAPWPPAEKPWLAPTGEMNRPPLRRTLKQGLQSRPDSPQNPFLRLPAALLLEGNQVEGWTLWSLRPIRRLGPTTFPKLSQDLLLFSVCFSQSCAKPSINDPASAPSPAKWVPDAPWRPRTKWGRKTLLRQISRENTIRQSKQSWRGRLGSQVPGSPPATHFQEPLENHPSLMGAIWRPPPRKGRL